jgi:hypothetical protein
MTFNFTKEYTAASQSLQGYVIGKGIYKVYHQQQLVGQYFIAANADYFSIYDNEQFWDFRIAYTIDKWEKTITDELQHCTIGNYKFLDTIANNESVFAELNLQNKLYNCVKIKTETNAIYLSVTTTNFGMLISNGEEQVYYNVTVQHNKWNNNEKQISGIIETETQNLLLLFTGFCVLEELIYFE